MPVALVTVPTFMLNIAVSSQMVAIIFISTDSAYNRMARLSSSGWLVN